MEDISVLVGGNGTHNDKLIEFVVLVELMPPWHARRVDMTDMLHVGTDPDNHISLSQRYPFV